MFKLRFKAGLGALFLSAGLLSANYSQADTYPTGSNIKGCTDAEMKEVNTWLSQSPIEEPNNEEFASGSICSFNAWSWQMFLFLTQNDASGNPIFLSFESPYDVLGIESREVLKPNSGHSPFDEVFQAGPGGILVDQNGNVVYYSQYLNEDFTQFIDEKSLTNPKAVQALDPNTSFPIGSVELKASWRIVEDGEDTSDVFTMEHEVYGVKQQGGSFALDANNIRKVKLALVGFHIGGVVNGHPEMIWSTFEHIQNSPTVPEKFDASTVIPTSGDYTFYDTDASAGNTWAACNKDLKSPFLKLDPATQKMTPSTQVCLQYKFGNAAKYTLSDSAEINSSIQETIDTNDASIAELNEEIQTKLSVEKNLWANYRQIGSIWFKGTDLLKPDMNLATDFNAKGEQLLIGSLMLSNSTIETFTQVASAENNCFRCHNTEQRLLGTVNGYKLEPLKPTNLNISHAFVNIYTWSQLLEKSK